MIKKIKKAYVLINFLMKAGKEIWKELSDDGIILKELQEDFNVIKENKEEILKTIKKLKE